VPDFATNSKQNFPFCKNCGEITPEYMGVGYIIGPKIGGVLVAGGILVGLYLFPLGFINKSRSDCAQLAKLGYSADITKPGGPGGWDPPLIILPIGPLLFIVLMCDRSAGAVAAGGFITLIKTIPTIISSFKGSIGH
jgi:hypothetical protein